MYVQRG